MLLVVAFLYPGIINCRKT
nr:unnamed protein product [Callosobruchus chinensis]